MCVYTYVRLRYICTFMVSFAIPVNSTYCKNNLLKLMSSETKIKIITLMVGNNGINFILSVEIIKNIYEL